MPKRYAAEVHEFIRANYQEHTQEELAAIVNEKFGTDFTPKKMKSYFGNYKLKAAKRKPVQHKVFPDEIRTFIKENIKGVHFADMAEMLNQRFGTSYTYSQIRSFCTNYKIANGIDCRLKPGNVPFSKGKTWDEFMTKSGQENSKKTCFSKGHKPANKMEVGDISLTTDGYMIIKVNDSGPQWERWKFMHRLIYEEHFGPAPEGCMIIFKDGNKLNLEPENLQAVTMAENFVLNAHGLRSVNPEITQARITIMRIQKRIRNAKKRSAK